MSLGGNGAVGSSWIVNGHTGGQVVQGANYSALLLCVYVRPIQQVWRLDRSALIKQIVRLKRFKSQCRSLGVLGLAQIST